MTAIVAFGAVLATASSGMAALLNLVPGIPDVASGFVSVSYNAQTNLLQATGFTQNVNVPPTTNLNSREFTLLATIDNTGTPVSGGVFSMMVRGDYGGVNQILFQSSQLAPGISFGSGAVDTFEFIFLQQSGSLAPVGSHIGTILSGNFGGTFPGNVPTFTQSFTNVPFPGFPGSGAADTFLIPSPSAAAMLVFGGVAGLNRRRGR